MSSYKVYELADINKGLYDMGEEKMKGALKFKIFKLKKKVEDALKPAIDALEGASEEDAQEIFQQEEELELDHLTFSELEPLEVSPKTLMLLHKIIKEDE